MAWKVELSREAKKQLAKLGAEPARRIAKGLRLVAALGDPRDRGRALAGDLSGHWRYRFGDYRVVAKIEDGRMVVVFVTIGHRREIYR